MIYERNYCLQAHIALQGEDTILIHYLNYISNVPIVVKIKYAGFNENSCQNTHKAYKLKIQDVSFS
jgi:hypothetical protein